MRKITISIVFILFFSCSTSKIFVKKISDLVEINLGDTAWVYWDFANAHYVKVSGFEQKFNPSDTIFLVPIKPLRLDIWAFGENNEQVLQSVYILVNYQETLVREQKQSIQRGPRIIDNIFEHRNTSPSSYFLGFTSSSLNYLSKLKIFRAKWEPFSDSLQLNFGLLDDFGNFGHDVNKFTTNLKVEIDQKCQDKFFSKIVKIFPESYKTARRLNVFFLIDFSFANENPKLKQQIHDAIKFLDDDDRISLNMFGVEQRNFIPLVRADKFFWDLEDFDFPKRKELSSIYRSLSSLMDEIDTPTNSTIILITNKMDNSSLSFTIDDVIDKSLKKGIPINTLVFGNEVSYSTYSYIAKKTGGNFYHFPWNVDDIKYGLTEIILSNKYYYSLTLPIEKKAFECDDLNISLVVQAAQIKLSDNFIFPIKDRIFYTSYQAVSLFNFADTSVNETFFPVIDSLAQLLVNHRNLNVELIGTAGIKENYSDPIILSINRAYAVKSRLISRGALPSQIRTKGVGISKPLFPDEFDETTELFNRRVEIRWLIPEVLPYTIVVDTTASEEIAEKKVEFWEKQGYKAYYDRLFSINGIMYKIVLWGYPKYEDAEKDANKISKKFRKSSIIE